MRCLMCDTQAVCIGGYWMTLPIFCCESQKHARRHEVKKISHRRK